MKVNKSQALELKTFKTVKDYRLQKGFSQKQLASLLGIKRQQTVSDWECGEYMPSEANLEKMAQIFEVSVEDLRKNLEVNFSLKQLKGALKQLESKYQLSQDEILALMP